MKTAQHMWHLQFKMYDFNLTCFIKSITFLWKYAPSFSENIKVHSINFFWVGTSYKSTWSGDILQQMRQMMYMFTVALGEKREGSHKTGFSRGLKGWHHCIFHYMLEITLYPVYVWNEKVSPWVLPSIKYVIRVSKIIILPSLCSWSLNYSSRFFKQFLMLFCQDVLYNQLLRKVPC